MPNYQWIIIVFMLNANVAQAQTAAFNFFNVDDNSDGFYEISTADSLVEIILEQNINLKKKVKFWLTPYKNSEGIVRKLSLESSKKITTDSTAKPYFHSIIINVSSLNIGEEVTGYVMVTSDSISTQRLPLLIKRTPRKKSAQIVLENSEISLETTESCVDFDFVVSEMIQELNIEGLQVKILDNTIETDNTMNADLVFTNANKDTIDLWNRSNQSKLVHIAAGKNYLINGHISNLKSGKGTLKLELNALNTSQEQRPVLTINLLKKDPIYWTVIVILSSIGFIIVTKKWVAISKIRIGLKKKVNHIYESIGQFNSYNAAEIRLKRILRMVHDVSSKSFSNFAEFDADLTTAAEMEKLLQRAKSIAQKISAIPSGMKHRRIKKNYSRVIDDIAHLTLDETNKKRIEQNLIKLESWFSSHEVFDEMYAKDLEEDVKIFLDQFKVSSFDSKYQKEIQNLYDELINANKPVEKENIYAILKIFWEKKNNRDALDQIYTSYLKNKDVDDVFKTSDDINWEMLQAANEEGSVHFILPKRNSYGLETFKAIHFKIAPENQEIGNNFLFKHGLLFHWEITIEKEPGLFEKSKTRRVLEVTTNEPRVTQFSPITGKVSATVTVCYGEKQFTVELENHDHKYLQVVQSSATKWRKAANVNEIITYSAAIVIALLTGILSYYFSEDFIGTRKEYLLMFLWGAGIEQGTSFLSYLNKE